MFAAAIDVSHVSGEEADPVQGGLHSVFVAVPLTNPMHCSPTSQASKSLLSDISQCGRMRPKEFRRGHAARVREREKEPGAQEVFLVSPHVAGLGT